MLRPLHIKIVFLVAFLIVLDVCFAPVIQFSGVRPIFSFLLIAYAAFQWDSRRIMPLAFSIGLLRDVLGGGILGVGVLALVSFAFILDGIAHKIEREFPGIYFLLTVIFCFFVLGAELLLDAVLGKAIFRFQEHGVILILCSFYTALFLPLFYQFADFLFKPHAELRQYELFRG